MRIKDISVKGLFGVFDHNIPMTMDNITIIHGPNGYGKTVLLKMLHGLFNGRYQSLQTIPFASLKIVFDDLTHLEVARADDEKDKGGRPASLRNLRFRYFKGRGKTEEFLLRSKERREVDVPIGMFDEAVPGLERTGPETWVYLPTQEELNVADVLQRFSDYFPARIKQNFDDVAWLKELRKLVQIRFIEAQRLLRHSSPRRGRPWRQGGFVPAVMTYSEELAGEIQSKLAEYATLSQSLDRTFPTRLVKTHPPADLTLDMLRNRLSLLEEKREQLMEAGLLGKEKEFDFSTLQEIDESNRNVLWVYAEDANKKLSVFDELRSKIDVLKNIVNSRFSYKELVIGHKEHGFIFKTPDAKKLLPTNLSSGEQHEIVLFYELLFKVAPGSLILIDEPELSLHVIWQQKFLEDLDVITKLGHFDVLIATHSPQIIHDRWDLTVELEGPSK